MGLKAQEIFNPSIITSACKPKIILMYNIFFTFIILFLTGCSLNCRYLHLEDNSNWEYRSKHLSGGYVVTVGDESFVGGASSPPSRYCGTPDKLSVQWQELAQGDNDNWYSFRLLSILSPEQLRAAFYQPVGQIIITKEGRKIEYTFLSESDDLIKQYTENARITESKLLDER